jgi:hypothetical protein
MITLFSLVHAASLAIAPDTTAASATELFTAVVGNWSCQGAFADGRALAADLSFATEMGGRVVRYHHADRAPTTFLEDATWGHDPKRGEIVSLAFAGSSTTPGAAPSYFVSREWTARSIVLVADTLKAPPRVPNRFTYTLVATDSLRMVWEVQSANGWRMGDWLGCARSVSDAKR